LPAGAHDIAFADITMYIIVIDYHSIGYHQAPVFVIISTQKMPNLVSPLQSHMNSMGPAGVLGTPPGAKWYSLLVDGVGP